MDQSKRLIGLVAGLAIYALNASNSYALPVNGGFETGDFTGWSTLGATSVQTAAFGTPPTEGTFQAVLSSGSSGEGAASAALIEAFLGLPTGSLDSISTGNATEGSAIKQTFSAGAGTTISVDWNFLTDELTPQPSGFNDFGFISIAVDGVLQVLADTFSSFGPSGTLFNEETGYFSFTHTLVAGGSITLGLGVMDVNDTFVDSGLLVDNLRVVPEPTVLTLLGIGFAGIGFARRRVNRIQFTAG